VQRHGKTLTKIYNNTMEAAAKKVSNTPDESKLETKDNLEGFEERTKEAASSGLFMHRLWQWSCKETVAFKLYCGSF